MATKLFPCTPTEELIPRSAHRDLDGDAVLTALHVVTTDGLANV